MADSPQTLAHVRRAARLARMLDDRFVDPIVGLVVPGGGDLITAGAGLYVVFAALRRGLPASVITRMLLNLALDVLLGAVPAVGDLFDFAFRANIRNTRLLEDTEPTRSSAVEWLLVGGAALLFLAALALPIALLAWAISRAL